MLGAAHLLFLTELHRLDTRCTGGFNKKDVNKKTSPDRQGKGFLSPSSPCWPV
jgi:hypothetical protein